MSVFKDVLVEQQFAYSVVPFDHSPDCIQNTVSTHDEDACSCGYLDFVIEYNEWLTEVEAGHDVF